MSQGSAKMAVRSASCRSTMARRLEMMSDMFDDHDSVGSSDSGSSRSGKHCDACNEWLDSSDSHCPNCGSER